MARSLLEKKNATRIYSFRAIFGVFNSNIYLLLRHFVVYTMKCNCCVIVYNLIVMDTSILHTWKDRRFLQRRNYLSVEQTTDRIQTM